MRWQDELVQDYGQDVTTAAGAKDYNASIARARRPLSKNVYVRRCLEIINATSMGRPRLIGEGDPRLIKVGFCFKSPRDWITDGWYDQFLAYWGLAVMRPAAAASIRNQVTPQQVFRAWRAKIPAKWVLTLGPRAIPNTTIPSQAWRKRALIMYRAIMRTSLTSMQPGRGELVGPRLGDGGMSRISNKALRALGRLSPELQRAALIGLPDIGKPLRIRDLNWKAVGVAQRAMQAAPDFCIPLSAGIRQKVLLAGFMGAREAYWVNPLNWPAAGFRAYREASLRNEGLAEYVTRLYQQHQRIHGYDWRAEPVPPELFLTEREALNFLAQFTPKNPQGPGARDVSEEALVSFMAGPIAINPYFEADGAEILAGDLVLLRALNKHKIGVDEGEVLFDCLRLASLATSVVTPERRRHVWNLYGGLAEDLPPLEFGPRVPMQEIQEALYTIRLYQYGLTRDVAVTWAGDVLERANERLALFQEQRGWIPWLGEFWAALCLEYSAKPAKAQNITLDVFGIPWPVPMDQINPTEIPIGGQIRGTRIDLGIILDDPVDVE